VASTKKAAIVKAVLLAFVLSLMPAAPGLAGTAPCRERFPSAEAARYAMVEPCPGDKVELVRYYKADGTPINPEQNSAQAVIIEPGTTKIEVFRWTDGKTYEDDEASGIASTIWNITLTIRSYFARTAGQILLDIAQIFADTIDKNRGATARLYHSYSYPDKDVYVYTSAGTWKLYVTSRPRQWYRHHFGSYANSRGFVRTYTIDYTADRGYPPIHSEWSPHYFDEKWLIEMAQYRWRTGLGWYIETY